MWRNRGELAAQGVVLPGHHPQDHFRASQDLRGIPKLATDPAGSWTGEWDILARQARQAPRVAVISHELFSAADAGAGRTRRQVAAAGRGARRPHRAGHRDAAARRVAGDGEAPQRPRLGRLAGGRDRPGVEVRRPAPVVVLAGARHDGHPRHLVPARARGARARDHDPAARVGQRAAVGALRRPARRRPWQRGPHPRPAERLARDGRDRVPAAAEPGASRRGPRLVLHVERQGNGRPPGPGRAAARRAAWSSPPTGTPGPRSRRKA